MIPRSVHRALALIGGYFWLPCPCCGEPFGGHEVIHVGGNSIPKPGQPGMGLLICPQCTKAGKGSE